MTLHNNPIIIQMVIIKCNSLVDHIKALTIPLEYSHQVKLWNNGNINNSLLFYNKCSVIQ